MIYMTTDEWHEISKLEENDFYKLAEEIASRTYDLDISKQELDDRVKNSITTLDDIGIWDSPEYCLRKLITSLYGREDYLVDCVSAISATTNNPELPEASALQVQDNYESKKFDRAVEQVALLMKNLAVKQYMKKGGIKHE